ncbi:MAG: hypothetical protein ACREJX_06445, partial [Polyangiaceae bacterium]
MRNWRSLTLGLAAGVGAAASFFACTGRWCTTYTNVLACDDFDVSDDHPAQQALSTQAASGDAGASIILSTNAAYSAPNGIVASTFPFEGNAGSGVALTGPLWIGTKAPPASITCEFQILPASLSTEPDDAARVFAFDLVDPAGTYHGRLGLVVAANGAVTFQEDHLTAQSTTDLAPLYLPSPPIGADPLDGSLPDDDSGVIVPPPDAGNASTITPIPIALGGGWFHVK